MQNILVTGGAGFIGSNFVRLCWLNIRTITIDGIRQVDLCRSVGEPRGYRRPDYSAPLHFVQGDICDASAVNDAIAAHKIDTIVNFAAETHVDRSILNPDAFIQTDVYGTYVLLEAARRLGNLRYHQISTDEVYGHIEGDHRSTETDCLAPRSPYAASKASGDHLVNAYHITYDLPITISRGANNIGPYQYPEKVVPLFVDQCAERHPVARLWRWPAAARLSVCDGPLCGRRSWCYIKGEIGETYNIGTGTEMTNLEMVEILLDELGKPSSLIQHVEDRQGHDRRYCLDVARSWHWAGNRTTPVKRPSVLRYAGMWRISGGGNRSGQGSSRSTTNVSMAIAR